MLFSTHLKKDVQYLHQLVYQFYVIQDKQIQESTISNIPSRHQAILNNKGFFLLVN